MNGSKFTVRTDNNPLTYVLTTAKLDATGHHWFVALSSYNVSLVYRAERINRLSRLQSTNKETLFNDVIRAICHAALYVSIEEASAVECALLAHNASIDYDEAGTDTGSDLSQVDWPAEQTVDTTLYHVGQLLSSGIKPTKRQIALEPKPCQKELKDWGHLFLKDDILYCKHFLCGTDINQLVLPEVYHDIALQGLAIRGETA